MQAKGRAKSVVVLAGILFAAALAAGAAEPDRAFVASPRSEARADERQAMVEVIQSYGVREDAVLAAMAAVPRHEFVPVQFRRDAYADRPLPIGHGQTISQPYIVAEMTRQLRLQGGDKVLEVGTGSGYQAAVLSELTSQVYTVEIIPALAKTAAARLTRLGYDGVQAKTDDGYYGWVEHAPFDAIVVTCAAGQIPPPLLEQLAPGGRMVIPVGTVFAVQQLMLVTKDSNGEIQSRSLMPVRFVPLVRED
jgi:protein-L-isoaspartate(D-aspartate) O-methyltransferase